MHAIRERRHARSVPRHAVIGAVAVMLAALALCGTRTATLQGPPQQPRFTERVDVSRVVVDVRVIDNRGRPIADLVADDFAVRIDGKTARVESARWVGGGEAVVAEQSPERQRPPSDDIPSHGRLIVFVFQKNWEGFRIRGLMEMLRQARAFLDTLTPADRVAILSFDSHLKIWADFTNDIARLQWVLNRGILMEDPPRVEEAVPISLVARLSQGRGERTYHIEKGLGLIAEALEPLPGSKSIVLVGHGFGRFTPGMTIDTSIVQMEHGYEETVRALRTSRASVFSLDVTRADYHHLELGLQQMSDETGGFYERTHLFPEIAMKKIAGALAGYYVLLVETPDAEARPRKIDVDLTRRKGNVYVRPEV